MAYNPFDEVIENDPAYKMQIGGAAGLAESRVPNYQQKADEAAKKRRTHRWFDGSCISSFNSGKRIT